MKTIRKLKYHITIILIIITVVVLIIIKNKLKKDAYNDIVIEEQNELETISKNDNDIPNNLCTVDIKGAINNPGIYQLECDKYVHDVIKLAGDLTENADTSFINLAKKINDEMVIIIYTKEEVANSKNDVSISKTIDNECICPKITNDICTNDKDSSNNRLININTATIEEFKTLPGIGEAKAKAIVEYRKTNGNFKNIEDIKNVSGIGDKLYEQIKTYLTE